MTDVVEIANERSDALAAEIDTLAAEIERLDDFVRMAERLLKHSQSETDKASATEDEKAAKSTDPEAAETTGPATVRPFSATADGNGAESEHEDLPVGELKAGERVRRLRTTHNEPSPDRPRGLGLFRQGVT